MSVEPLRKEKYRLLLQNERSFHLLFCVLERYAEERLTLYSNAAFSDDPIFNHFVLDETVLESADPAKNNRSDYFSFAKQVKAQKKFELSIFIEDFWEARRHLEKRAVENGFRVADGMEILSKPVTKSAETSAGETSATVGGGHPVAFETTDVALWTDIFMRSYSIPPYWKAELLRRENEIVKNQSATFVLANLGAEPAGCLLAHIEPSDCVGIYCVGTPPEFRHRGIARIVLTFAEELAARKGCKVLTLQTLTSDGVSPMYKKIGYMTDFTRDILMPR